MNKEIFRAYDIRGVYGKDLDEGVMEKIGMAVGTFMKRKGMSELLLGNDVRSSSPALSKAFISGLSSTGVNATDVGTTSFGAALFSGWSKEAGVTAYITASHNPPEWNGIKFFDRECVGFFEEDNKEIGRIAAECDFETGGRGIVRKADLTEEYVSYLSDRFLMKKPVKVVIDCGNGSTSVVAERVFKSLKNVDAEIIFGNVDSSFPERGADVEESNLSKLADAVKTSGADIGIAFDGDGDRVGVVDERGRYVQPEKILVMLAKRLIGNKTDVVVNVETSMMVEKELEPLGAKIVRVPVGHTFLSQSVNENNSAIGGEPSSHYLLPQYMPFDDAMVAALKIIEVLSESESRLSEISDSIRTFPKAKASVECDDETKFKVMKSLKESLSKKYESINTMDGIRIELNGGWVLIRPSNTGPTIRITAEADSEKIAESLKSDFLAELKSEIERVKTLDNAQ